MVHRDHINLSTTFFYSTFLLPISIPILSSVGNYGYIPFLFGSLLPDLDISLYEHGHRFNSPAHNLGYALSAVFFFAVLAFFWKINFPMQSYINDTSITTLLNNFGIYKTLVLFLLISLGWCAHLIGDFIQGGMKFFNKRIGFRSLTWDIYYGQTTSLMNLTYMGSWIGWLLLLSTYAVIYFCWQNCSANVIHPLPIAIYFICAATSGCGKALASLCTCCTAIGAGVLFSGALPVDLFAYL